MACEACQGELRLKEGACETGHFTGLLFLAGAIYVVVCGAFPVSHNTSRFSSLLLPRLADLKLLGTSKRGLQPIVKFCKHLDSSVLS